MTDPAPERPSDNETVPTQPGRILGLIAGPLVFLLLLAIGPPAGLEAAAWRVAAMATLMVVWWVSEALPLAATALVPVALLPLLGVMPLREAAAPYAHPLIFLFLGGFTIALALERWSLHKRVALTVLRYSGTRPAQLVGGFMLATALLSMWISNTASTVMMLPIGLAVLALVGAPARGEAGAQPVGPERKLGLALLLGIAYAASIGGFGTLIGTPPNAFLAAFLAEHHGIQIGFGRWMLFGVPLAFVMLAAAWLLLTRVVFRLPTVEIPGAAEIIGRELSRLGSMTEPERRLAAVFILTVLAWAGRPAIEAWIPDLPLSDPVIAVLAALALFVIPVDLRRGIFLMDWNWAKRLPWGVLILFGGGLSLATGIQGSGLSDWIGDHLLACQGWPLVAIIALITAVVVFLTEVTSNTATAAVFIPVAATLGVCVAADPLLFTLPAALAASCAFMMPIATPPNAIVYASGQLRVVNMVSAGFLLNLVAIVVISLAVWLLGEPILGSASRS